MAAVPEGLPMQGLQQPDRSAKVQLLTKTSTRLAFQRDERWKLGIIFRNSGFCKAFCFKLHQSAKGNVLMRL
jgi:hypothetical protein